jgi:hypothetical protein
VVKLQSLITGWYDDRQMFHKIGYLVAVGHTFADLVSLAEGQTKSSLHGLLDGLIRDSLNLTASDLKALDFESSYEKCFKVLLLMNVETVRNRRDVSASYEEEWDTAERYSFRAHSRGDWSLEHIHAQNAGEMKRDYKLWQKWLELQERELMAVRGLEASVRDGLLADMAEIKAAIGDEKRRGGLAPRFNSVRARVEAALSDPTLEANVSVHSISNLALLASGDNSALSNSTFAAKRRDILERDRSGSYIPACTRNVFQKYYTKSEDQQFYYWSGADRDDYLAEMIRVLGEAKYLRDEESAG